jgi:hypothetical protein
MGEDVRAARSAGARGTPRRAALAALAALACDPAGPSSPRAPAPAVVGEPGRDEDLSFVRSDKLAEDVQELVVRAYGAEVSFTFDVQTRAPLDRITRERFAERGVEVVLDTPTGHMVQARVAALGMVAGDARVQRIQCAAPQPEGPPPADERWRRKVAREVRIVVAAKSACWFEVALHYGDDPAREPPAEERAFLEAHGARIVLWTGGAASVEAKGEGHAVAWVPVALLPHLAARDAVSAVEARRGAAR